MGASHSGLASQPADPGAAGSAVVFGGGLAGLAAGHALTLAGRKALVLEADAEVGGLSKTLRMGGFRFDIGGHRFHTKNKPVEELVRRLVGGELSHVSRKSSIFMRGRFFDYPIRPANAVLGLGPATVVRILVDYYLERLRATTGNGRCVSLEDWVVRNFGRTMFEIYFKEYSEKVWGLDCSRISESWVEKRIQGLSLGRAIKNAFFKFSGREIATLADSFLYPDTGIGRIAERLKEEICAADRAVTGRVVTGAAIAGLEHDGKRIKGVTVRNGDATYEVEGDGYISTIPLNALVSMMRPEPPRGVMEAARGLGFRDLVVVAVSVDREYVTNQSWVYIPEKKYPFGRLHEPKCWSPRMAPPDKTLLVVEYFCFRGDRVWNSPDADLVETTVSGLEDLGFINRNEAEESMVVRAPRAYPLFEVGYERHCETIYRYLDGFENLHIAGRSGTFQYQNMDVALASGIEAAEGLTRGRKRI